MNIAQTLRAHQSAIQAWLLQGDADIAASVEGENIEPRLRIYADAYRLRLIEVLGNDFPTTKSVLGDDAFAALAIEYMHAHPSTQPSVRHFGHAFADWLAMKHNVSRVLHELARFEWRQGEAFDAADVPLLAIEHVAALPAEAWPGLRLRLQPSVRLLALACNAPALVEAQAQGRAIPTLRHQAISHWLLWRNDGDVHWRRLGADEAIALHAIAAFDDRTAVQTGDSFAQLCERLNEPHGDGALRAASLLKRWLADGLLVAT